MGRGANVTLGILMGLLCVSCSSGDPGQVKDPSPPAAASTAEKALGCDLVSSKRRHWQDQPPSTGSEAIEALVEALGLDQSSRPWPSAGTGSPAPVRWLLFNRDGTGYGVASASRDDSGAWTAWVEQICARVVPLPPASPAPSTPKPSSSAPSSSTPSAPKPSAPSAGPGR